MTNIAILQKVSSSIIYSLLEECAIEEDMMNVIWSIAGTATSIAQINSLLTTAFLSIDRYTGVKYGINYQTISTMPRMF